MSCKKNRTFNFWVFLMTAVLLFSGCIKVSATSPANNATGVARDAIIHVTFNMAVNDSTVSTESFQVKDSLGNPVTGTVTYANKVATFTPASKLALLQNYTVTLTTGIKDILGFTLKENYSFCFTTCNRVWGTAQLIKTNDDKYSVYPQVAFDTYGNAMVIWGQYSNSVYSIWSNRYTSAKGWETPQLVADNTRSICLPQFAFNAKGNAVAVWFQSNGSRDCIWSNIYTPESGWGTPQLIETNNTGSAFNPQLAVDAEGNAVAVWQQFDGTKDCIWFNRYTPGNGWGVAALIDTDDLGSSFGPKIANDANGNVVVVWVQSDGTQHNIYSNHYTLSNGWGTVQMVADNVGIADSLQIASDREGNAIAIWHQDDSIQTNIWSNHYTSANGWDMAQVIDTNTYGNSICPQVAFDANGIAITVWQQRDESANYNICSNRYIPGTGWGSAQVIDMDNGYIDFPPCIDVNPNGNAIAVWNQYDGNKFSIYSNRYDHISGWGSAQLIETDNADTTDNPQIAIYADGSAMAVWDQYDDTLQRKIWFNCYK